MRRTPDAARRSAQEDVETLDVRDLRRGDVGEVARIDRLHTGALKRACWAAVLDRFLRKPRAFQGRRGLRIGLAAQAGDRLAGYLLGESRAFEFGSEQCGWIFAVGVDPKAERRGVASRLLSEACARFRDGGVPRVRTMVRRNDVPVLSFFRGNGFRGGPFVQLELDTSEARLTALPQRNSPRPAKRGEG